jgi:hypothetical protein
VAAVEASILSKAKGAGGDARVSAEELTALKAIMDDIRADYGSAVLARRSANQDTRLAVWDGQSEDGKKRRSALGKDPKPYEGASDNRIRLADETITEMALTIQLAATRGEMKVSPVEGNDEQKAQKNQVLLRHIVRNVWGSQFGREVELAAQWMLGDEPGISILYCGWHREMALESKTITRTELAQTILGFLTEASDEDASPGTIEAVQQAVSVPERAADLQAVLEAMLPHLPPARIARAVQEIYTDGAATIPVPYDRCNAPALRAMRLYDDVWLPPNTTDIQRARAIIVSNWYTRDQVLAMAAAERWDRLFVGELLGDEKATKGGCEGRDAFAPDTSEKTVTLIETETESRKGLFQVLDAYVRQVNADGIPAVYRFTYSGFVDRAATEKRIIRSKHGAFPFVACPRESLDRRLLSTRGVPGLVMTDQAGLKLLSDSFEDYTQETTHPPTIVPEGKPRFAMDLGPRGQIPLGSRDRFEYLAPPPYPIAADKYMDRVELRAARRFGRSWPGVPPDVTYLHKQAVVTRFLGYLADAFRMVLQDCYTFMATEQLARIMGGDPVQVDRSAYEIAGGFDVYLNYDVRDGDLEYVTKKTKAMVEIARSLDPDGVIPYASIVRRAVMSIDPTWAEDFPPGDASAAMEVQTAKRDLALILAGVQPDMRPGKGNWALRQQTIMQEMGPRVANPEAYPPISAASKVLLDRYLTFLDFQAQQAVNARTGRTGVEMADLAAAAEAEGAA